MNERKVKGFFYGSYINPRVLAEVELWPTAFEVARLHGWDIRIRPRANLLPDQSAEVHGLLFDATHAELERLYAHARDVLGEVYLPEAVLAERLDGGSVPALCYICHDMQDAPADNAYVERIAAPAREFGFPDWYLERIESFRS